MHDEILTMIPGPTPVDDSILAELARPTISHVAPQFVEAFKSCLADFTRVVCAESAHPFVVAGAGTLAMEMALVNHVAEDGRLLVVSQGFFGDRWIQLAEAFGVPVDALQAEWGQVVTPAALADKLATGRYSAVAMTHVDTSTGAAAPIEEYCRIAGGHDVLTLVDGVCATAGMEERFDAWGIDVLLTGAQKAFGAPPGVAMLVVSERALAVRRGRERVPAYYADLLRWQPIMENPGLYFSTPAVNEITALARAMRLVIDEGLDERFARHASIGRAVRAGLAAVGVAPFTDAGCLADTLTVARYPDGVDDAAFRGAMVSRKVVVAPALGPIAGKAVRIGHMGNIGTPEVNRLLQAIEESLAECGCPVEPGVAVAAAAAHLG